MTNTPSTKTPGRLGWRFWQSSGEPMRDCFVLGMISCVMVIGSYFLLQPSFNNDSLTYHDFARLMSGDKDPQLFDQFRTPGYPLLLHATGVMSSHTFYYLFLMQAVMGIVIPLFIYDILAHVDRQLAFRGAWLLICSLLPFIHLKEVMTEQTYFFLQYAVLCCHVRVLYCNRAAYLYPLTFGAAYMSLTRPSSKLMIVVMLLACVIRSRPLWKHACVCLLIYVGLAQAWSLARNRLLSVDPNFNANSGTMGVMAFSALQAPSRTLGSIKTYGEPIPCVTSPANGPASRELALLILQESKDVPITERFVLRPEINDWLLSWPMVAKKIGSSQANHLFGRVVLEALWAHPYVMGIYLRTFGEFLVGFPPNGVHPNAIVPYVATDYYGAGVNAGAATVLPIKLKKELATNYLGGRTAKLRDAFCDYYYGLAYTVVKITGLALALINLPFLWRSPFRTLGITCLVLFGYQALVVSVFARAELRYHTPVMPMLMMAALIGLHAARSMRIVPRA